MGKSKKTRRSPSDSRAKEADDRQLRRSSQRKKKHRKRHLIRDKSHHRSHKKKNKSRKHKHSYTDKSNRVSKHVSEAASSSSSPYSSSVSPETRKRRKTPHFAFRVGELMGHRYRVISCLGTGTFGRVLQGGYKQRTYAIKVIKPVEKYISSAKTERAIVKEINRNDPEDRYHIVKYVESFNYCNHYCLVFERLGPSLYDITKKNNYKGFPQRMVRSFAKQLFEAVGFMHQLGYTHTDLKPENILLCTTDMIVEKDSTNQQYSIPASNHIKLIDFGGATHRDESHSSTINTRQYRSPEVLLKCCQWDEKSDVWSIGCIIMELFTGQLLFHVHDDIDHVYMIQKIRGNFPSWMTQRCRQTNLEGLFRQNGTIRYRIGDKLVKDFKQIMQLDKIHQILGQAQEELTDLVEKCLQIDPKKRISCAQALQHNYFEHKKR